MSAIFGVGVQAVNALENWFACLVQPLIVAIAMLWGFGFFAKYEKPNEFFDVHSCECLGDVVGLYVHNFSNPLMVVFRNTLEGLGYSVIRFSCTFGCCVGSGGQLFRGSRRFGFCGLCGVYFRLWAHLCAVMVLFAPLRKTACNPLQMSRLPCFIGVRFKYPLQYTASSA